MEVKTLVKDFLHFEENTDVFKYSIEEIPVWDFVRYEVFYQLLYALCKQDSALAENKLTKLFKFVVKVYNIGLMSGLFIKRGFFRNKKKYDLLVFNEARKFLIENKRRNSSCFYPIRQLAKDYKVLSLEPSPLYKRYGRNYPCDVQYNGLDDKIIRLQAKFSRLCEPDLNVINQICQDVKLSFNVDVRITDKFLYHLNQYKYYVKFFMRHQPKVILFADNGNRKGILLAARNLDIPTIELQHSVLSDMNITYKYPDDILKHHIEKCALPTYLFTWGEAWHSTVSRICHPIAIGNPYFEAELCRILNTKCEKNLRQILIIGITFSKDLLVKAALELSEQLPDFTIVYKLRAEDMRDWQNRYPKAFSTRKNIRVICSLSPSLYDLFAESCYMVGVNSTALIEGVMFGLKTFLLKDGFSDEMKILVDHNLATCMESLTEVITAIRNSLDPGPSLEDCRVLFKENSSENLRQEVGKIMHSRELRG